LVLALAAAGAYAWREWQVRVAREQATATDAGLRLEALEARFDAMRRDQRAQTQRLQQADATNRLLRDELLAIGQRAVLLEDSVSKLVDPDRHGAQALRLDETELLLAMGQRRLLIAGDVDGARRAYALAGGVLEGVNDPAYLSLRQTLQQERAALDALGAEPRVQAMAKLDAFANALRVAPPRHSRSDAQRLPWWRRAFANIVAVQPSSEHVAVQPADRAVAQAGLQLELSLARAAGERRDVAGYRAAIARAKAWLTRLWPPSPALHRQQAQLDALAAMPLSLPLPTLGTTLEQLRQMRASP
jgi:uroporphyrin-3 C-methyltransferase